MGKAVKKKSVKRKTAKRQAQRKAKRGDPRPDRVPGARSKPKVRFNLTKLRVMASRGNSIETIAAIVDVDPDTLYQHMKDDPKVKRAIDVGRATMQKSLRAAQFTNAVTHHNATMQIWLGKQSPQQGGLGQRDVKAVEVSGPDGGPMEVQGDLKPVLAEKLAAFIRSKANGGDG